ncbi:hypothetical protein D3M70_11180 [Pseudomonas sp. LS-2]|nr:hypothetical protein D3M70_11180 [Pseudomonas sp. LS-2]
MRHWACTVHVSIASRLAGGRAFEIATAGKPDCCRDGSDSGGMAQFVCVWHIITCRPFRAVAFIRTIFPQ